MPRVGARSPGRVNLIGDHTDYTGGLVLPMAIDRWTTIDAEIDPGPRPRIRLRSDADPEPVDIDVAHLGEPSAVEPPWGRYVAAVAEAIDARTGLDGDVHTTIPVGAGLSSSAALEIAVALALGADVSPADLAETCRQAEHRATGVPTGIMDQLSIAAAVVGHATLIDCHTLDVTPVPLPADVQVVVRFVAHRTLVGSAYADRVEECRRAEDEIGPLCTATLGDVSSLRDPLLRRRARHVVSENERVRATVTALCDGDVATAGRLLLEGHASLRDDYETSTPAMDAAVAELMARPGVHGARMTGGGFGGCIVALCEPGALADDIAAGRIWSVRAAGGPSVIWSA